MGNAREKISTRVASRRPAPEPVKAKPRKEGACREGAAQVRRRRWIRRKPAAEEEEATVSAPSEGRSRGSRIGREGDDEGHHDLAKRPQMLGRYFREWRTKGASPIRARAARRIHGSRLASGARCFARAAFETVVAYRAACR